MQMHQPIEKSQPAEQEKETRSASRESKSAAQARKKETRSVSKENCNSS